MSTESHQLSWGNELELTFLIDSDGPVSLVRVSRTRAGGTSFSPTGQRYDPWRHQPLVELTAHGHGRFPGGFRHVDTVIGQRLRYVEHHESVEEGARTLRIRQADAATGLHVVSVFTMTEGVAAFRSWTEVHAGGSEVTITFVSSFASGAPLEATSRTVDGLSLVSAGSDWVAESRWRTAPLRESGLARIDRELQHHPPRSRCVVQNRGSWSTGEALPTGVLVATDGEADATPVAWQVEHNGPWLYELGETRASSYLVLSGPSDEEHQWSTRLAPHSTFASVPVSVAVGRQGSGLDGALAAMTDQRRAIRVLREIDSTLPVVFNDYMNTLMGDPTTEKLLPLIDATARIGADCFCIDAGWYADGHWWDNVGEWRPSARRFPGGLAEVIDRIRGHGMTAGLWLEPEVIGVNSPLARTVPEDAFFSRAGVRVAEHGRHLLDLRHPAARAHLDEVVDRLIGDYGVGFFKMDYNTMPGPGTDRAASSAGDGMLGHARALIDWIDAVQERHPSLIIESCASGAMRMDYATLSRLHMQSTSDQQDPVLYATIAAAAPASILPEQAGHWAYPNPRMHDELFALSLVNGILGRMYLSGYLNRMSAHQTDLVRAAIAAHREVLAAEATAHPTWPLGLPGWNDGWVCSGLAVGDRELYLSLWRRSADASESLSIPLPEFQGQDLACRTLFPASLRAWKTEWTPSSGLLTVSGVAQAPAARVLALTLD